MITPCADAPGDDAHPLVVTTPASLSATELAAIAELERRVVAHDGGRLKLEWGVLPTPRVVPVLAWRGETLVGYVGLYVFGPPDVELAGMVDPAARRQGVGTALLQAALPRCRERGFRRALLVSSPVGAAFARAHGGTLDHSEHAMALGETPDGPPEDPSVTLAPATGADLPDVRRLMTAGFGFDPGEERLEPGDATMVVRRGGELVGTLRLNRLDGTGGIYGFVVDPVLQGRGIGRDVLARACRLLRAEGLPRVTLEVSVDNERALGLYTTTGFAQEATEDYWAVRL